MAAHKQYSLNPETLMYEPFEVSLKSKFLKTLIIFLCSIALSILYFWLYTSVFGQELPKTAILKKRNAVWASKVELLGKQLDYYEDELTGLEMRNDDIYRSIFGMSDIPQSVRMSGLGPAERYADYDALGNNSLLKSTAMRIDVLTKQVYVQSKSFDEVATLSKRAGDMASCIPAIPPINPDPSTFRFTSNFGYRSDPISGVSTFHAGVDFATDRGNLVYSTGDGVVESVKFQFSGYGNEVVIDHGFGYKTRYAHLDAINVAEGMKVKRGDCIAESGNTGKTTGPHLHYEVIYRGSAINPVNFFDLSMSPEEYESMTRMRDETTKEQLRQPFRLRKR